MNIEKNEKGCVRFADTDGITYEMWGRFLRSINHLGYAIPDEDALKRYFDRGVFLQSDQSRVVLDILNGTHSETRYSEKEIREANRKAKEHFGLTENSDFAGYILTDGDMLCFSYEGYKRDIDHRDIADAIDPEYEIFDDKTDAMIRFIDYGNIRLKSIGFELIKKPTSAQKRELGYFINTTPDLFVDIANSEGKVVKTLEYHYVSPAQVFADIEEYFKSLE